MRLIIACSTRQWMDDALWLISTALGANVPATVFCVCLRPELLREKKLADFEAGPVKIICIDGSDSYTMNEPSNLSGRFMYTRNAIKNLKGQLPAEPLDIFITDNMQRTHDLVIRSLCDISRIVIASHGIRRDMRARRRKPFFNIAKNIFVWCMSMVETSATAPLFVGARIVSLSEYWDHNIKLTKIAHEEISQADPNVSLVLTSGVRRYGAPESEDQFIGKLLSELQSFGSEDIYLKTKLDEPYFENPDGLKVLPPGLPLIDTIRQIRPGVIYCHCSSTVVLEALLLGIEVQVYGLLEQPSELVFSHYSDQIRQFLQEDAREFHSVGVAGTLKLTPSSSLRELIKAKFKVADVKPQSLGQLF